MRIKLVRKDGEVSEEISLSEGTHIFGRGRIINCDDKRVSRNHVSLQITKDGIITFTALHTNPCFYYSPEKPSYAEVLLQNNRRQLKDEDEISLLPESYRYAVQVVEETDLSNGHEIEKSLEDIESSSVREFEDTQMLEPDLENGACMDETGDDDVIPVIEEVHQVDLCEDEVIDFNEPESTSDAEKEKNDSQSLMNVSSPSKRKHEEMNEGEVADPVSVEVRHEEGEGSCKKIKVESPEDNKPNEQQSQESGAGSSSGQDVAINTGQETAEGSSSSGSTQVKEEEASPSVKVEKKDIPESLQPRDKCEFGTSCYRRNPQHRKDMSHPGDPDWDASVSCPYGANCYRTNAQHRSMYTHPGPPAPRPQQQNGKNDKQRKATTKPKKSRSKREKRSASYSDSEEEEDSLDAAHTSEEEEALMESGEETSDQEDSEDGNVGGTKKRRGVQTRKISKKRQAVKYYQDSGDESGEEEDPWEAADSSDDYEPSNSGNEREKGKNQRKPVFKKARR